MHNAAQFTGETNWLQNEAYFLRRERTPDDPAVIANRRFHGLNQWPDDLPGFRATTLEYMRTLERLCRGLVPLYALALDLPADFFDVCFAVPHMILRMSRYPVIDGEDETVASLVPHTDSGFMTLLPPNRVPGLSILLPSGRWIEAPGIDGAYVVNGGDILHRWTNERFLSTPHRVRNCSGRVRYAIPFFCDPDHDTVIKCLPSCRSADNPAKYPPVRFGDYALWFARKSYEHMANEPALPDAVVAPGHRATVNSMFWPARFALRATASR
jgi:isopenicillin N synthase-like dioxygenase